MGGVRNGVDVGELTGGFADGTKVLGGLHFGNQPILLDDHHIDEAECSCGKERQLVCAVGGGRRLIGTFSQRGEHTGVHIAVRQDLQHPVVGKGAGGVQQTVGRGESQGEKALGVLIVAGLLPFQTKLRVLRGIHHTQTDGTRAHQRDSQQGQRRVILTADEQQRQHCHQCAGGIADGGRNGQLDIPQAQIAQSHGTDIQQGHRQVGPDDGPADGRAAYEDLKGGVKAHHHAHGDDHFQVTVTVAAVPAADFGKEVAAAPAQEGSQGKPKPHGEGLLIEKIE